MACGLFVYAGATDFLDGYIARNFKNQASSLGSFLDPLSDKILVGEVLVSTSQIVTDSCFRLCLSLTDLC